jgi:hypothetical protein
MCDAVQRITDYVCDYECAERRLGILKIDMFRFGSNYRICFCRHAL